MDAQQGSTFAARDHARPNRHTSCTCSFASSGNECRTGQHHQLLQLYQQLAMSMRVHSTISTVHVCY
jgi:hypothetical protein